MRLQELIPPEHIVLGLEASDKWEAIAHLMHHLVAQKALDPSHENACQIAVLARERSMSTGMERGIAIPHAAIDGLARVVAALGVVRREEGVDFASIDSTPASLIVLLLIPRAQKLQHIRTLADLARHLGNEDVRRRIHGANTPEEAWQALAGR
jgi:PTS system fructose-specific IIA component/PTS system nitrogen regulatory IIA component